MDAAALLRQMAEAYDSARTYEDRGVVSTVFIDEEGRREARRPFATAFERPRRFRFEFRSDEKDRLSRVIRRTEDATVMLGGEAMTLSMALGAVAGISSGASINIPRLLLPKEVQGWCLAAFEEPRYEGIDERAGAPCHRIAGRHHGEREVTVWLDVATLLIRRIFQRSRHGDPDPDAASRDARLHAIGIPANLRPPFKKARARSFETEMTTSYDPRKDPALDAALWS